MHACAVLCGAVRCCAVLCGAVRCCAVVEAECGFGEFGEEKKGSK